MIANEVTTQAAKQREILALIRSERKKSVSVREWKHRLVGYGYAIRNTANGDVISRFGSQEELCGVPAELLH